MDRGFVTEGQIVHGYFIRAAVQGGQSSPVSVIASLASALAPDEGPHDFAAIGRSGRPAPFDADLQISI
jgi:hypothetical protein